MAGIYTPGSMGFGFVLGDEGAGTWFGKALITDFLYGKMPAEINKLFDDDYNLDKEVVIKKVYQLPNPNSYLASFSKFLSEIRHTAYGQALIKQGLLEFINTNIKSYREYHNFKCHFVGSIAYIFADELKAICHDNGVHPGKIIKEPIHDLLAFI